MKTILKNTLCSTVALVALTSLAHADSLNDLKNLMDKLNKRDVASQASLQVPRGYKVNPTADAGSADAGAAVDEPYVDLKVTGYIKTGYVYNANNNGLLLDGTPADNSSDIDVEGGVNVKGSVQSALGEVGATIQAKWDIAESSNNAASTALRDDGLIGFWQFADTLKLEAGRSNAGRLENGIDKNTRRLWTFGNRRVRAENAGNGFFDRDMYNGFMGIAYASGPVTMNLRVHDATRGVTGALGNDDDAIGMSSKATFSSEMINFELAGGYWGQDDAKRLAKASQTGVKWLAGAGTELNFIPGVPVSIGAQMGRLHNGTKMMNVSTSIGFTLTDQITLGIGAGMKKLSGSPTVTQNRTEKVVHGEIYYAPMTYLSLGLEGEYYNDGLAPGALANSKDGFSGAIVSRYSF